MFHEYADLISSYICAKPEIQMVALAVYAYPISIIGTINTPKRDVVAATIQLHTWIIPAVYAKKVIRSV